MGLADCVLNYTCYRILPQLTRAQGLMTSAYASYLIYPNQSLKAYHDFAFRSKRRNGTTKISSGRSPPP